MEAEGVGGKAGSFVCKVCCALEPAPFSQLSDCWAAAGSSSLTAPGLCLLGFGLKFPWVGELPGKHLVLAV